MDYTIYAGSSLNPQQITVGKADTPTSILNRLRVRFDANNVSLNGRVLASNELDQSVETLGIADGAYLVVSTKQNSGLVK